MELSGLFANPRPTSFMQVIRSVVKVLDEGNTRNRAKPVLAATLDDHEDDTLHEHEFMNVLSPWSSFEMA